MEAVNTYLNMETLSEWIVKLGYGFVSFFLSHELLSYAGITAFLLIGACLYLIRRQHDLLGWLFPKAVWEHASSKLDIRYYFVIQAMRISLVIPLLGVALYWVTDGAFMLMESLFGQAPSRGDAPEPVWQMALYTFLVFVGTDFGLWLSHYLSHKWPVLWCFHKVHHSAEVLNPFTAMRFHPLDQMWNIAAAMLFSGLIAGICQYGFFRPGESLLLLGNNVFIALSYITTHTLRHSHLWLHYPHWLSRVLVSPAMHQLHHSAEYRHWDTNFGYLLSCWDRWVGTDYVPETQECFTLGVREANGEPYNKHRTIRCILLTPFAEAWALYRKSPTPRQTEEDTP
jgi:sterol desaturase/sphingolipid hydroxylase (fatty acid hydroxylase superfamily)